MSGSDGAKQKAQLRRRWLRLGSEPKPKLPPLLRLDALHLLRLDALHLLRLDALHLLRLDALPIIEKDLLPIRRSPSSRTYFSAIRTSICFPALCKRRLVNRHLHTSERRIWVLEEDIGMTMMTATKTREIALTLQLLLLLMLLLLLQLLLPVMPFQADSRKEGGYGWATLVTSRISTLTLTTDCSSPWMDSSAPPCTNL